MRHASRPIHPRSYRPLDGHRDEAASRKADEGWQEGMGNVAAQDLFDEGVAKREEHPRVPRILGQLLPQDLEDPGGDKASLPFVASRRSSGS